MFTLLVIELVSLVSHANELESPNRMQARRSARALRMVQRREAEFWKPATGMSNKRRVMNACRKLPSAAVDEAKGSGYFCVQN
jgi:hypothetical protein